MDYEKPLEEQIEALKMDYPAMFDHPEAREGEVFIQNMLEPAAVIPGIPSSRIGKQALSLEAREPIPDFRPVFVDVKEYLAWSKRRREKEEREKSLSIHREISKANKISELDPKGTLPHSKGFLLHLRKEDARKRRGAKPINLPK